MQENVFCHQVDAGYHLHTITPNVLHLGEADAKVSAPKLQTTQRTIHLRTVVPKHTIPQNRRRGKYLDYLACLYNSYITGYFLNFLKQRSILNSVSKICLPKKL